MVLAVVVLAVGLVIVEDAVNEGGEGGESGCVSVAELDQCISSNDVLENDDDKEVEDM